MSDSHSYSILILYTPYILDTHPVYTVVIKTILFKTQRIILSRNNPVTAVNPDERKRWYFNRYPITFILRRGKAVEHKLTTETICDKPVRRNTEYVHE